MAVSVGARLGPYQIVAALGAGGMGEVYRARDERLRRDVAIKVLPTSFSAHADRLRRFEQEARAAAALNHPSILAVHDIGTEDGAPFIVSELLEGQTLRERLQAGPVPIRKVVTYAIAIARGLAAAHEKGIVHRDLKPENLFVTSDDRIKILDFGLAKLVGDPHMTEDDRQTAPPATELGQVLGTVGYMAPEQVRGLPVDHRADLFAFGAVLYELVTGDRAFHRETAAETMAAILKEDPPHLAAGERPIPPALSRIVERCLEKPSGARFQTASDLAFALEGLSDTAKRTETVNAGRRQITRVRGWAPWAVAAALLLTLAPIAYQHARERSVVPQLVRFRIPPGVLLSGPGNFSVSPDGRFLAFFGQGANGTGALFLRAMDSLEVRPLAGSEVPWGIPIPPPIWSPDGRFVAFQNGESKLKKLNLSGGPPQVLCDLSGVAVGGSWNRTGDIIFGNTAGAVLRVSESGGVPTAVTATGSAGAEEFHLLPSFLPDGRHFVYLRVVPGTPEASGVYVGNLDAKAGEPSGERLMPYQVGVSYAPATDGGPGRLLFLREGTVMAQLFDEKRLALAGTARPVVEHVGSFRDSANFSSSANDVLVYRAADADSQLAILDRSGTLSARVSEPGGFRTASLSPRGDRAVVSRTNTQDAAGADLWLYDLSRRGGVTRLTFEGLAEFPLWSPDGRRIVYTLNNNTLYQKLASGEGDGKEIARAISAGGIIANGWSPDGRFLLYSSIESVNGSDLFVLPVAGSKPLPFLQTKFAEDQGRFSPDGRWVAYVSDQSGTSEVYVRAFTTDVSAGTASAGGSVLVSRSGGTAPRWRGDGKELFYLALDGKMMAVEVSTASEFRAGTPTSLFQTAPGAVVGDVSPDGKQFFLVVPTGPSASSPFTVVLNWTAGLKQ